MGIFSRRQRNSATSKGTTVHHNTYREKRGPIVMDMSRKPTFSQWLKVTWPDIVTMIAMGLIGLGVYEAHPAPSRSFPVYFQDGEIIYSQFAYPMRKEIVPIWAAAMLGTLVPIAAILICQIRIRSFWDVNNGAIGVLYSLITAAVFQFFLKWLIGGLRPHFLTVCNPNVPEITAQETSSRLKQIMYDRTICTGDQNEIDDFLESFPSGHSTAAFAGFVFLSLYLNAKLKLWSNYHPAMWKQIAVLAPILGATLIAGALTIDEYHNWYDCVASAIIGTVMAFSSYRMVYASIFEYRTNHIPLNRAVPFPGAGKSAELEHSTFTRQVGWGMSGVGTGNGYHEKNGHGGGLLGHGNGAGVTSGTGHNTAVGGNGYHSGVVQSPSRKPVGGHSSVGGDHMV